MKATRTIFLAILIMLGVSCGPNPSPDIVNVPIAQADCSFSVFINGEKRLAPNQTTRLAVDEVGLGWQYNWFSSVNNLSEPNSSSTQFTAPEAEGSVTISVSVVDDRGCLGKAETSIEIISQPGPDATNTIAVVATAVPTPSASPTSAPTATQTATFTPASTPSHTPPPTFTNTPASTPLPSYTPTSTVPAFQIFLKEPKNETCVGTNNAVFEWEASRPLNATEGQNGEYYALNIWAVDTPVHSVSWIKAPRYEIESVADPIAVYTQEINCNGANGCFWNVDLIVSHVERGSGWLPGSFTKIASSPVRNFCTHLDPAPIPPTNTPAPAQPTATPCNLPPSQCK